MPPVRSSRWPPERLDPHYPQCHSRAVKQRCLSQTCRSSNTPDLPPNAPGRGATMYCAPSSEGLWIHARAQDHNVNWLVPATNCYPIVAAPWVLRLDQGVKRCREHNLARGRVGLKASANIDCVT